MRHVGLVTLLCLLPLSGNAQLKGHEPNGHEQHGRANQISFDARLDYPTGLNLRSLTTGDFNRDGYLDIAAVNAGVNSSMPINCPQPAPPDVVSIFNGTSAGKFQLESVVPLGSGGEHIAIVAGDFNHDGWVDLAALAQQSHAVRVLYGGRNGTFKPPLT